MSNIEEVAEIATGYMNEINKLFKPGVKLTLLARTPGNDDADFLLSDDDLNEAVKALKRRAI